ncbi:type VI secretion system baseplate subunit TssG [Salinisphaera sp.]|uniref:type VI secretion system baseplate subunit TssG n=1 Tax=Salinisphaera sp. TaxID=1914330 RepID=UPI000C471C93|nr:type VI secretion system baseplate subunit TssG [Salinisphaera sp.]MBS63994.1 type VI secretion system baseplate subunit TssG [Salinisphaera sp.]
MPSARRRFSAGITQSLLEEPYRYGYFQAVRLLELYFSRGDGRRLDFVSERLRFRNTLSLDFPPSELKEALALAVDGSVIEDEQQRNHAIEEGDLAQVAITPAFFGLLGTNGALPLQYTERLIGREIYQRDRAARAFFDIFSNRSAALFYAAWKKYRLPLHYELDRRDRALPVMLSFAGMDFDPLKKRLRHEPGCIHQEAIANYASAFWRKPASASMVERVVADYFGVEVRLEQFVARWYDVPPAQRTYLGQANATLGGGALSGERVMQCDICVRLWIGPLKRAQFTGLLPGGDSAEALKKLVQALTGVRLEYEVVLILAPEEVRGAALDADREDGRLGWDAFLCSRQPDAPRADAGYRI